MPTAMPTATPTATPTSPASPPVAILGIADGLDLRTVKAALHQWSGSSLSLSPRRVSSRTVNAVFLPLPSWSHAVCVCVSARPRYPSITTNISPVRWMTPLAKSTAIVCLRLELSYQVTSTELFSITAPFFSPNSPAAGVNRCSTTAQHTVLRCLSIHTGTPSIQYATTHYSTEVKAKPWFNNRTPQL